MLSRTEVDDYIRAAMHRAVWQESEDPTVGAYVPGLPGIVAFGSDRAECQDDLRELLEDWVSLRAASGEELPALDGLGSQAVSPHTSADGKAKPSMSAKSPHFESEAELEAEFARRRGCP